jgi:hypothetical protein
MSQHVAGNGARESPTSPMAARRHSVSSRSAMSVDMRDDAPRPPCSCAARCERDYFIFAAISVSPPPLFSFSPFRLFFADLISCHYFRHANSRVRVALRAMRAMIFRHDDFRCCLLR